MPEFAAKCLLHVNSSVSKLVSVKQMQAASEKTATSAPDSNAPQPKKVKKVTNDKHAQFMTAAQQLVDAGDFDKAADIYI